MSLVSDTDDRTGVMLVDDHEIVRRGLRGVLEEAGDFVVVGEASGVGDAVAVAAEVRPDLAIVDLRLGDGSGVEVCRQLAALDPPVTTLVLTAHGDVDAVQAAVAAGAAGYVLKQLRGPRLLETVRRVAAGERVIDPDLAVQAMVQAQGRLSARADLERLTPQETRILDLVGAGMSNREIARQMRLAEKTVKNYVSAVLAKLALSSRTQAALFVARHRPQALGPDDPA